MRTSVSCGVCGHQQEVMSLASTNTRGPSDLDSRPAEMKRSTMHLWRHECSECRYVASDLGVATPRARALVRSPDYIAERAWPDRPGLANRFVCGALVAEIDGDLAEAAWNRVYAAWACDDAGLGEAAAAQRTAALALFERVPPTTERRIDRLALLVDLARRAGLTDRAAALAGEGRNLTETAPSRRSDVDFRGLFELELRLCQAGDTARHDLGEVPRRSV
jgi:hypothetical protein